MSDHAAFIQSAVQPAQTSQAETGVPSSVTIAQAILESGWGDHHIDDANNYFGIKAVKRSDGSVYYGNIAIGFVEVPTREVINGQSVTVNALFTEATDGDSYTLQDDCCISPAPNLSHVVFSIDQENAPSPDWVVSQRVATLLTHLKEGNPNAEQAPINF